MIKAMVAAACLMSISIVGYGGELTEKYTSVARGKGGEVSYKEQHLVTFLDGRVQKSTTSYLDREDKLIGELSSDFGKMLTTPEYLYKDLRSGTSHGIRIDGEKIVLWRKDKDGKLEEAEYSKSKFDPGALIVGCQGMHYYLIDNLDKVRERKTIPIKYLMPGALDYFSFTLRLIGEDDKFIYLKLTVDNLVLKLLTSSLEMKYRKADRRLVQYSGLSNITNDKDQTQYVKIDYKYD